MDYISQLTEESLRQLTDNELMALLTMTPYTVVMMTPALHDIKRTLKGGKPTREEAYLIQKIILEKKREKLLGIGQYAARQQLHLITTVENMDRVIPLVERMELIVDQTIDAKRTERMGVSVVAAFLCRCLRWKGEWKMNKTVNDRRIPCQELMSRGKFDSLIPILTAMGLGAERDENVRNETAPLREYLFQILTGSSLRMYRKLQTIIVKDIYQVERPEVRELYERSRMIPSVFLPYVVEGPEEGRHWMWCTQMPSLPSEYVQKVIDVIQPQDWNEDLGNYQMNCQIIRKSRQERADTTERDLSIILGIPLKLLVIAPQTEWIKYAVLAEKLGRDVRFSHMLPQKSNVYPDDVAIFHVLRTAENFSNYADIANYFQNRFYVLVVPYFSNPGGEQDTTPNKLLMTNMGFIQKASVSACGKFQETPYYWDRERDLFTGFEQEGIYFHILNQTRNYPGPEQRKLDCPLVLNEDELLYSYEIVREESVGAPMFKVRKKALEY